MAFDWKKLLGGAAPALATALGGPMAGVAASMAVKALGGVDQGSTSGNMEAVAAAVTSGDPSVFVKLKQAENELILETKRIALQQEKLYVEDRANARDMAKTTGIRPQVYLSALYTLGFLGMVWLLFKGQVDIPEAQNNLASALIAIMSTLQVQMVNFWFGSSAGSKDKTMALGK